MSFQSEKYELLKIFFQRLKKVKKMLFFYTFFIFNLLLLNMYKNENKMKNYEKKDKLLQINER